MSTTKRRAKYLLAFVAAAVLALAMAVPAFAVTGDTYTYDGTDKTTDGAITMSNATKDTTYTLYKIFDATYQGDAVSYTITSAMKTALNLDADYFTVSTVADANGNYAVTRTMDSTDPTKTKKTDSELMEYLKAFDKSKFIQIGAIKSTVNGTITWEKIPYGYYYIFPDKPESQAVVTINTNTPVANVIDKNQTPEADKKIVQGQDLVEVNEAGLAIDVPFQITIDAKNYDGEYKVYQYIIKDEMDPGFTLKNDMKVMVGSADKTSVSTIKYYTDKNKTTETTYDKAGYFEITVNWTEGGVRDAAHLYPSNETITVTYSAFLDPAKADKVNVGTTANVNKADFDYMKWNENPNDDSVKGTLPQQTTETFETAVTINKTDGSSALTGAEFELTTQNGTTVSYITQGEDFVAATGADATWYKLKDGTYTETEPTTATQNQYESDTPGYKKVTVFTAGSNQAASTMKAFVDASGKLTFSGLGTGTYTLKETVVPKGYNQAADLTFTISFDADPDSATFKKFSSDNVNLTEANNVFETTVVNNKGAELPSTGGIGTTILYVIGGILVLGAVVFLITKRRMAKVNIESDNMM